MQSHRQMFVTGGLFALVAIVLSACASPGTPGTGEVVDPSGDPVRVPVLVINQSFVRMDATVAGVVVETVLPGRTVCVLLPPRVDNLDLVLAGPIRYTVIRQLWSGRPGWQVTVPEVTPMRRLTPVPAAPCM